MHSHTRKPQTEMTIQKNSPQSPSLKLVQVSSLCNILIRGTQSRQLLRIHSWPEDDFLKPVSHIHHVGYLCLIRIIFRAWQVNNFEIKCFSIYSFNYLRSGCFRQGFSNADLKLSTIATFFSCSKFSDTKQLMD